MQQLYREREHEIATGPGLTALVIYLRPSIRTPLLSVLSDLGVFVVECVGDRWRPVSIACRSDLAVVVGDCSAEHLNVVTEVSAKVCSAVVGVSRTADHFESFERAGALACVTDGDTRDALFRPVEEVAKLARRMRDAPRFAASGDEPTFTVFGDVQFRLNPPLLMRETRLVPLSLSECDALLALAERLGSPVSTGAIEERLGRRSVPVSSGYVKTIMLRVRRKVDSIGGDSAVLGAVRGFGYVLRG